MDYAKDSYSERVSQLMPAHSREADHQLLSLRYDKKDWGDGPWQSEPDRVEWEHMGYNCLITRHDIFGNLCGYVGVGPTHPLYGRALGHPVLIAACLEAHGGVNYSAPCSGHVCHVPGPGEADLAWWFGFDCGHGFDIKPGMRAQLRTLGFKERRASVPWEDYRDLLYVTHQVEQLAQQLREIEDHRLDRNNRTILERS